MYNILYVCINVYAYILKSSNKNRQNRIFVQYIVRG